MTDWSDVIARAESLLQRAENLLSQEVPEPDWAASPAFRWRRRAGRVKLEAVHHVGRMTLDDLQHVGEQKARLAQNTQQFVQGLSANNVLLTGARGTGKSSLMRALLTRFAPDGLRMIEVHKADLVDLPDIVEVVAGRPERFILFCDDLSFEATEPGYKALKSVLDGSLSGMPNNVLVYATSNRRHLMPEYMEENLDTHRVNDEIHPGETVEEKVSLSERFGLWLSFYPFTQDEYLTICAHWLTHFGLKKKDVESAHQEALQWALMRGSRSGRVAWQFARDYAGRHGLGQENGAA